MNQEGASPVEVVMAFLACAEQRDFSTARALLDENVTRAGPDGDVKSGRDEYVAYLETVLADARGYRYDIRRSVVSEDGHTVLVEIDEALTPAHGPEVQVSEAMIFDLTAKNLIGHLSVYTKVIP